MVIGLLGLIQRHCINRFNKKDWYLNELTCSLSDDNSLPLEIHLGTLVGRRFYDEAVDQEAPTYTQSGHEGLLGEAPGLLYGREWTNLVRQYKK